MLKKDVQVAGKKDSGFKASAILRLIPAWLGNLIIFGILVAIVFGYVSWQVTLAQRTFLHYAKEHTRIVSGLIKQNAHDALLSQKAVEKVLETLLGNTAGFIGYLEAISPFSELKLLTFAKTASLVGVSIISDDGTRKEAPREWLPGQDELCQNGSGLIHMGTDNKMYVFVLSKSPGQGCITVGISSSRVEEVLQKRIGLANVINNLSGASGILYVKLESDAEADSDDLKESEFIIRDRYQITETRVDIGKDVLIVGLDTKHFFIRVKQLWNELLALSGIMAFIGGIFTWIIYLNQRAHLEQARAFERQLAKEHEDAALGRAAAIITHEIRNPLNAINMGLQRLQIESNDLEKEHRDLISTILSAVNRTDSILANLKRYSLALIPTNQDVDLVSIVKDILALYQQQCSDYAILVELKVLYNNTITGDPGLLEEVVENLIKNAIEAQPNGGYLAINIFRQGKDVVFSVQNSGFVLSEKELEHISEPYFTTKASGSGLGLAIARRIILAHGGRIEMKVPRDAIINISAYIPIESSKRISS